MLEHVTVHGFLKNPREKNDLIDQLNERGISKYFITYSYLVPSSKVTRDQIKSSSGWIHSIIDVINPRAIVLLGDMCCHTFFTRKEQAVKRHGEIIGKHNEIPVLLSFNLDYYFEHTKTEDVKYKEFIREHDWEKIKELYDLQVAT